MSDHTETQPVKTPAEVRAELLEHLEFELVNAKANFETNERDGFPEAAASWLPIIAKWQRMISFVEKA